MVLRSTGKLVKTMIVGGILLGSYHGHMTLTSENSNLHPATKHSGKASTMRRKSSCLAFEVPEHQRTVCRTGQGQPSVTAHVAAVVISAMKLMAAGPITGLHVRPMHQSLWPRHLEVMSASTDQTWAARRLACLYAFPQQPARLGGAPNVQPA